MKIEQVERRVGLTKRNIRFYEKEGLLPPAQDGETGCRDYTEEDVACLKRIRLLRLLNVPVEELRRMESGLVTLEDVLDRHILRLEREQTSLSTMASVCRMIREDGAEFAALDADRYLARVEELERGGTHFADIRRRDVVGKYLPAVAAAVFFVGLMAVVTVFVIWDYILDAGTMPLGMAVFFAAVPAVSAVGVIVALKQRVKEIRGGEEDAASEY